MNNSIYTTISLLLLVTRSGELKIRTFRFGLDIFIAAIKYFGSYEEMVVKTFIISLVQVINELSSNEGCRWNISQGLQNSCLFVFCT